MEMRRFFAAVDIAKYSSRFRPAASCGMPCRAFVFGSLLVA
jgi:hypothetical protein